MRVRQGWSGEVGPGKWAKFDVELEEEDLRRLLSGMGLPAEAQVDVPIHDAFRLLEAEAERLVLVKLISRYGYAVDEGKKKLASLVADQHAVIESLQS